jgi:hypothetical protein
MVRQTLNGHTFVREKLRTDNCWSDKLTLIRQPLVRQTIVRQRLVGQMSAGQALRCPNGASQQRCITLLTMEEKLRHHLIYYLFNDKLYFVAWVSRGGWGLFVKLHCIEI